MKNLKFNSIIVCIVVLSVAFPAMAQDIGDVKFKTGRAAGHMNTKKLKKAPKKIYIAEFFVNYQLMYSKSEVARGGREIGGGYRGDASASLILGVPNIDVTKLQQNTDQLYQEYTQMLKDAGYEIVPTSASSGAATLEGWQMLTGGSISESQNPGYLFTAPTGFDYYVKKVTKKGRAKTGLMDYTMKLSKDLNGTIVARVQLVLPIAQDAESRGSKMLTKSIGGVAKVVAEPAYRVAPSVGVQTGKMSGTSVNTLANYSYMKSMGEQAFAKFSLDAPVEIGNVFESKKYKAVESADSDIWGTSSYQMGALTVFNVDDKEIKKMQVLDCDPEKFTKGAYEASKAVVSKSVSEFLLMTQ